MKQLTEDYVSYEIAVLLKEKGFDEYCIKNYWSDKELHNWKWELSYNKNSDANRNTRRYAAPTLQMALKWLREVHNWYIDIRFNRHYQYYIPIVYNMNGTLESIAELEERPKQYEQAVEASLLYVLKNLI